MQGSSSSLDERLPDSADRIPLVDENMQLYRALRNGAGPPCTKPWVSFEERSSQGMVKPCCWLQGTLGQIRDENDVPAIWNGTKYRTLRQAMGSGSAPPECPNWCPVLTDRQHWFQKQELYEYTSDELLSFDRVFLENRARVMKAIRQGDELLEGTYPLRLHLHPSDACNLRCVMCYLDLESGRKQTWYGGARLPDLMQYLEEIKIFGGEPFFCETSRALILNAEKPRWTHTSFLTNGMLVTDRVIDALEAVRIGTVDVSLDAADAATYERIRLRGNFTKALAGARRLVELALRHRLRRFGVYADFVIQEFNYRHLTRFVELCSDVGLTPNFTLVGDNREATRRSLIQNTELGARPCDIGDLTEHLDAAIARADVLKLNFAASSLDRVRRAFHPMPMDPARLA